MTSAHADEISQSRVTDRILAFAHIGDLHITDAKQRNFQDFLSIVAQIEIEFGKLLDFVVLPGDNADNGLRSQYALIATALRMLSKPVHVIPGDHDREQGDLHAFYDVLALRSLPRAEIIRGARCLFLDISGPGQGGPDFRLGIEQTSWLQQELQTAHAQGETALIFMHSYPDDLKGDGEARAFTNLISAHDVALIDMGHTHYNELANDGRTVFAATDRQGKARKDPSAIQLPQSTAAL
jgi:3',5'-cyclic-AMP phosphodiesterase